jgi:hypothetical protein
VLCVKVLLVRNVVVVIGGAISEAMIEVLRESGANEC